jgi:phosphate transport system permease protein
VGLGAAIYLSEMAPRRWEPLLSRTVELLAAIPSVVYGLLGALILVPLLRNHVQPLLALTSLPLFTGPALGVGFLAASLILAIMILPILISLSRDALRLVPPHQREAALGLGATEAESILLVVLPNARRGVTGAVFLALARALGETMAVTMVIGNSPTLSISLLSPGYTIAAVLANEFTEASSALHLASLSQLAFILLALSLALQLIARQIQRGDAP